MGMGMVGHGNVVAKSNWFGIVSISGGTTINPTRFSTLKALRSCVGESKASPAAINEERRIR